MSRLRRSAREVALTMGAVLGVVCLLSALAATFLDVHLLVFRSGSMSPAIETGGAALARTVPARELATGDIVSVTREDGTRVTHRVVEVMLAGEEVALTLRGDANTVVDAERYVVTSAERVFLHGNHVGYVVDGLASPVGYFAGGAAVVGLLFLGFGGGREPRPRAGGRRRVERGVSERGSVSAPFSLLVAGGLAVVAILMPSAVHPTLASWTDSATATGGTFSALTVPAPTNSSCSDSSGDAVMSWTGVGAGYTYLVVVTRASDGEFVTSATTTHTSITFTNTLLGNLLSTNFVAVVRAFPTGSPTWLSSGSVSTNFRSRLLGLGTACGHV